MNREKLFQKDGRRKGARGVREREGTDEMKT